MAGGTWRRRRKTERDADRRPWGTRGGGGRGRLMSARIHTFSLSPPIHRTRGWFLSTHSRVACSSVGRNNVMLCMSCLSSRRLANPARASVCRVKIRTNLCVPATATTRNNNNNNNSPRSTKRAPSTAIELQGVGAGRAQLATSRVTGPVLAASSTSEMHCRSQWSRSGLSECNHVAVDGHHLGG